MSQMRPVATTKPSAGKSMGDSESAREKADQITADTQPSDTQPYHALHRLLSADRTRARAAANSRKRALEHGCEVLAGSNELNARAVLDALLARERLGSTALGEGVAIPHCRLPECTVPVGVLISLDKGVDYNAPDDKDVDLLFILVVPDSATDEHLQVLSQLASILIDDDNRRALRDARDNLTLFETMIGFSREHNGADSSTPGAPQDDNSTS